MTILDEGARHRAAGACRGDFYEVAADDEVAAIAKRFGREPWQVVGADGVAVVLRAGPASGLIPRERLHFTNATLDETLLPRNAPLLGEGSGVALSL